MGIIVLILRLKNENEKRLFRLLVGSFQVQLVIEDVDINL